MYSEQIAKIVSKLESDKCVTSCTCFAGTKCIEEGKITCQDKNIEFLHIRFDPCMMPETGQDQLKRCDCIIFGFDKTRKKQAMFVIEVKDTYRKNTLDAIKEKIQTCVSRMQSILEGTMNLIEVFPIMTDLKHSALCAQASMTKNYKVKCYNSDKTIIVTNYRKNIVDYYTKAAESWK